MNKIFLSGGRVLPPSPESNNKTSLLSPFSKSPPKSVLKIAATTIENLQTEYLENTNTKYKN